MFLNHDRAFAEPRPTGFLTRPDLRVVQPTRLFASTMVETDAGWRPAGTLKEGQRLQTLDGGLVDLISVTQHKSRNSDHLVWHVPAGVLDTCSDLELHDGQLVAICHKACQILFGQDIVLAPINALIGYRGIMPRMSAPQASTEIRFASEEIIYAQTGALLHVREPALAPFFQQIDHAETWALLNAVEAHNSSTKPAVNLV